MYWSSWFFMSGGRQKMNEMYPFLRKKYSFPLSTFGSQWSPTDRPTSLKAFTVVPIVFATVCVGCVIGLILLVICATNSDEARTNEQPFSGSDLKTVPCVIVQKERASYHWASTVNEGRAERFFKNKQTPNANRTQLSAYQELMIFCNEMIRIFG